MVDQRLAKFGKLPPKVDERTLKLADYIIPDKLRTIPAMKDWADKIEFWSWTSLRTVRSTVVPPLSGKAMQFRQFRMTPKVWAWLHGALQRTHWNFREAYVDEAYPIFSKDWIEGSGHATNGIDWDSLRSN